METTTYDLSASRKIFSRIGFSLVALLLITSIVQTLLAIVLETLKVDYASNSWLNYSVALLPLYLVAFPVFLLMTKKIEGNAPEENKLKPGHIIMYAIMCLPLMYIGNLIGLGLTTLLQSAFNLKATHALQDLVIDSNPLATFIFAALLAPIIEEIIFRKILIDKTIRFGKGLSILLSGLLFGLFHGNFYQFFYAFALGLLFAYIYTISGKLRYVIGLHIFINFLGTVLAPSLLNLIDLEMLDELALIDDMQIMMETIGDSLVGLFLFGMYIIIILGLSLVGIVLLIINRKKFSVPLSENDIPKGKRFKTAGINPGIIAFTVGCIALFVMSLLM